MKTMDSVRARRSARLSNNGCGKKRALLIFPQGFYSFADVIRAGLASLGYEVVIANDEYPRSVVGKILGKLGAISLLSAITEYVLERDLINSQRYHLALIVKGRGISSQAVTQAAQIKCPDNCLQFRLFRL
jgi:hypothetical protein